MKIITLSILAFPTWAEIIFIPLYNRSTEEILPVVQQIFPSLPISSYGGQLVINGKSQDIEEVQTLIKELDIPARQLLITIADNENNQLISETFNHRTHFSSNLDSKHFYHDKMSRQLTAQRQTTNFRQLLVNEGSPIVIQTQRVVPNGNQGDSRYGSSIDNNQHIDLQHLYINVRVVGQQVYIDMMTDNSSLQRSNSMNQQTINNHISGQLGSWINLGSFQHNASNNLQNHYYYQENYNTTKQNIRLKVELKN